MVFAGIVILCLLFTACILITGRPAEGWWAFGLCVCVMIIEFWLWINVGLPRAVKKGSEEFKRAYYGSEYEDEGGP